MEEFMERRMTQRFPVRLPMTVRWTTRSGILEAQTESLDVSSGGTYFFLSKEIEDGSPVEIVISLPDEIDLNLQTRPCVCCQGHIQRTEVIELNRVGVAAQIERYQFSARERGLSVS
jgi:PilZ domain